MTFKLPLWTLIPGMAILSLILQAYTIADSHQFLIFRNWEWYIIFNLIFAAIILLIDFIGGKFIKCK